VSVSSLQPGDLVFYGSPIHHVALYVGGGQVIHAPQTGDVVRYASVDMMPIVGAVRP
jgi:cell wall-associated NlpC family hydrolase